MPTRTYSVVSLLVALALLSMGPTCGTANTDPNQTDPNAVADPNDLVEVTMVTTMGTIVFQLDRSRAPVTVENFLTYVNEGFYDGVDGLGATIFHRVYAGFVIQGGGFTEDLAQKDNHDPITLESNNGLLNVRGTVAMARTAEPDTATSQFYINLVDNTHLDYVSDAAPGYCVFGAVISGMEVADAIAAVDVEDQTIDGVYLQKVPLEPITITSVTVTGP